MEIIKLSTPWSHNYYAQTPDGRAQYGSCKFEINNDCDECDWWVVWGGLIKEEKVRVRRDRIIYITDEAHEQRVYDQSFLEQFSTILSVRTDIISKDVVQIHELAPWYFNKSYDELVSLSPPIKSKTLSVVCSDLTWLPGHKKRFAFVNRLIGHFKDKLDVYGRGFNAIPDKYHALADYKYSIAIENSFLQNYFTEKISECFLAYTLPIYCGCPNISEYYDDRSFLSIDIDDYIASFQMIEETIEKDIYEERLPYVIDSRNKFLQAYHLFPALISYIKQLHGNVAKSNRAHTIQIIPEEKFRHRATLSKLGVKHSSKMLIYSILNKIT